jgi:hypothetical protein
VTIPKSEEVKKITNCLGLEIITSFFSIFLALNLIFGNISMKVVLKNECHIKAMIKHKGKSKVKIPFNV